MKIKKVFWIVYLLVLLLLTFYTLFIDFSVNGLGLSSLVKLLLQLTGTIGIYGLLGNRKIFTHNFWKIFFNLQFVFVIIIIMTIIFNLADSSKSNMYSLIFFAIYGPYFYGLYLYSYKCPELWSTHKYQN